MTMLLEKPVALPQKITSEGAYRSFLIIDLLRSTGEREFPAQLMSVFFWIAAHDGCKQEDLPAACNMSASSVSRCVTWLGPRHRIETRSGLKLVRRERDPDNYKAYRLYLTPKGKIFTGLLEQYASGKVDSLALHTKAKEDITDDHQDLG